MNRCKTSLWAVIDLQCVKIIVDSFLTRKTGSIKGIKRNINLQLKVTLKIVVEYFFFGIWQAQSMWEKSTGSRYKQARLNKQLLCGQHF